MITSLNLKQATKWFGDGKLEFHKDMSVTVQRIWTGSVYNVGCGLGWIRLQYISCKNFILVGG